MHVLSLHTMPDYSDQSFDHYLPGDTTETASRKLFQSPLRWRCSMAVGVWSRDCNRGGTNTDIDDADDVPSRLHQLKISNCEPFMIVSIVKPKTLPLMQYDAV